jgi:hypothetical protein
LDEMTAQITSAAGVMARRDEGAWPKRPVTEEQQSQRARPAGSCTIRITKPRS